MGDIHTDTNSKGYFVLKNCFEARVFRAFLNTKGNLSGWHLKKNSAIIFL